MIEAEDPDHVEDVTGFEEVRLAALLAHRSQFRSTMRISHDAPVGEMTEFRNRVLGRLHAAGRGAGFGSGEAFRLMTDL